MTKDEIIQRRRLAWAMLFSGMHLSSIMKDLGITSKTLRSDLIAIYRERCSSENIPNSFREISNKSAITKMVMLRLFGFSYARIGRLLHFTGTSIRKFVTQKDLTIQPHSTILLTINFPIKVQTTSETVSVRAGASYIPMNISAVGVSDDLNFVDMD